MKADAFLLPDDPVQIAFSGGRTSGYMLRRILDTNGGLPDRCAVTFQNTGREMDETLDFVHEVGSRWNVPVVWHPLADAGIGRSDVARFWQAQPFDLRLPNIRGNCWLGNCDGCFLKSEANIAAFTRDLPDRAAWWEGWETFGTWLTNSNSAAFWSKRYTRASMREFMERQGDWALSTEGALCQKDEGECTPV